MAITDNMYQDLIMNPEFMPNRLQNLEMFPPVDNIPGRLDTSFQEIPGFNFVDAPTSFLSRLQNPQFLDDPRRGIMDARILSKGNPQDSLLNKTMTGITRGIDFGKKVGGGILSTLMGVPVSALNFFQRDPALQFADEAAEDFYSQNPNAANLMRGYNVSSMFGGPGLQNAYNRRIARIRKTLQNKQSKALEQRLAQLEKAKAAEAAAIEAAQRQATRTMASQNRAAGTGGYQADYDRDFMGGSGTAKDMGSS